MTFYLQADGTFPVLANGEGGVRVVLVSSPTEQSVEGRAVLRLERGSFAGEGGGGSALDGVRITVESVPGSETVVYGVGHDGTRFQVPVDTPATFTYAEVGSSPNSPTLFLNFSLNADLLGLQATEELELIPTFAWTDPAVPVLTFVNGPYEGAGPVLIDLAVANQGTFLDVMMQSRVAPAGPWSAFFPVWTTSIPQFFVNQQVRVRQRQLDADGVTIQEVYSVESETIQTPPIQPPVALISADVVFADGLWVPEDTEPVFRPVLKIPGLVDEPYVAGVQWTNSPGDNVPDSQWEDLRLAAVEYGDSSPADWMDFDADTEFAPFHSNTPGSNTGIPPEQGGPDYSTYIETSARRNTFWLRWKKEPLQPWSPKSVIFPIPLPPDAPAPEVPPPDPTAFLWRQRPRRIESQTSATATFANPAPTANYPQHYPKGPYGGEGLQICSCSHLASDGTLWRGGDMHGLRFSLDDGRTWVYPDAIGCTAYIMHSITTDPGNPDVVLVAGMAGWDARGANTGGIFRSTNKGKTFTLVVAMNNALCGFPQEKCDSFAVQLGGGAASRRIRFWQWSDRLSFQSRFHSSNDSGMTWSSVALGLGTERCHRLEPHSTQGTFYAATTAGLRKTTNDGASWATVGGMSGNITDLWVLPTNRDVLFVARYSDGVWYSSNGGASFTRILAVSDVMNIAVGAVDGAGKRTLVAGRHIFTQRIVYHNDWTVGTTPNTGITGNAATGWATSAQNGPDPSDNSGHLATMNGGPIVHVEGHLTDPNIFTTDGFALPWISTNRARNFRAADGYCGSNPSCLAFIPGQAGQVVLGIADELIHWHFDYGRYGTRPAYGGSAALAAAIAANATQGNNFHGITVLPNGRIIAQLGGPNGEGCIVYKSAGAGDWVTFSGQNEAAGGLVRVSGSATGASYRRRGGYHQQNPNIVWLGPNRSTNGGLSWGSMGSLEYAAHSIQNSDIVFGISGNTIMRSANAGASWAAWYALSHNPRSTGGEPHIWPARHDSSLVLTTLPNYDIQLLKGTTSVTAAIDLNLVGSGNLIPDNPHILTRMATWCPLDPLRFYVGYHNPGGPVVIMGYFNAAYTACTWTDVTRNFPRTVMGVGVQCHPDTGELFGYSGCGVCVLAPPTGAPVGGHYAQAALPFFNGTVYVP